MKKILLLSAVCCILAACNPEPSISLSSKSHTASSDEGTATVSVTTTYGWTASTSSSWIKVSPSSGQKGTTQVTLFISANGTFDQREGKVTFSSEGLTSEFTVIQQQKNSIIVSVKKVKVEAEGDTVEVKLKSNVDNYTVAIPDTVQWIQEISTKALKDFTHLFAVAPNDDIKARTGVITFVDKATGISDAVTITQSANIVFEMEADSVSLGYKDDILNFRITTNDKFKVINRCEWITYNDTIQFVPGELRTYTATFSLTKRSSHDERSCEISFTDASDKRHPLKIYQEAMPYLLDITYSGSEAVVAEVTNTFEDATIDWGDGTDPVMYEKGLSHRFETSGNHTVEVASSQITGFHLDNLCDVEKIDLTYL